MKNSILYIILILIIVMTSCSEGLYNQLIWPSEDPLVVSPDIVSFTSDQGVIIISWDDDPAAEEYILYKKPVNSLAAPVQIYRGTDLEYIDEDFPGLDGSGEVLYHYSLSKTRGKRAFGPSLPSLGIYSQTLEDGCEPNNYQTDAWKLSRSTVWAMMYYYRDSYNNVVRDEDWYCIDIDPGFSANVILDADLGDDAFQYQIYKQGQNQITLGDPFIIPNNSDTKKNIYFKIFPSISTFMRNESENSGSMIEYTIQWIGNDLINNR